MEFGLSMQGYTPGFRQAEDPDAEHHAFERELAAVGSKETTGDATDIRRPSLRQYPRRRRAPSLVGLDRGERQ